MENFGIDDFLEMMAAEKGAAQNTLAAYRRDVEQFAAFAKVSDVSAFRQSHISAFVQKLSKDKLAPKTIARKISALREYFKFLYSEREIKDNPAANILLPKQKKPLPKFLTEEEIRRLIAAAKAHDDCRHRRTAVMLELMYACGLRVSELVSLPENCLNYDKRQIMVKGKGSKERIVPVAPAALNAVSEYMGYRDFFLKAGRKSVWLFRQKFLPPDMLPVTLFLRIFRRRRLRRDCRAKGLPRMFCAILLRPICLIMTSICVRCRECSDMKISAQPKFIRISFQKR